MLVLQAADQSLEPLLVSWALPGAISGPIVIPEHSMCVNSRKKYKYLAEMWWVRVAQPSSCHLNTHIQPTKYRL